MIINFQMKFHELWIKIVPSRVYTIFVLFFFKIWPCDRVFEQTLQSYDPDQDFISINILTKFHELWIKTVPSRVYTRFFYDLK